LIIGTELIAPQPIKEPVEMGLPVIERLVVPDQLRQSIGVLQHKRIANGEELIAGSRRLPAPRSFQNTADSNRP